MSNGRYSLMGPAMLITVGTIFLVHEWRPEYHIGRLWPVILIVIGIIRILESGGSGSGPSTTGGTPPSAGSVPPAPGASTPGA